MKWTFEEDYIVCKFYLEHVEDWKAHIDELMAILKQHGFGHREKGSVRMRIQNYEHVHTGRGLSNVAKQSREIYEASIYATARAGSLATYIRETYSAVPADSLLAPLHRDEITTEFMATEPLGQKFGKVLIKFMAQQKLYDPDVYNSIHMSRSTFNDIKNDKCNPSTEKVLMLCVGLKLSYDDSVELMAAAGFVFRNNNMMDVIVKWHLQQGNYNTLEIDCALCDYHIKTLFSAA